MQINLCDRAKNVLNNLPFNTFFYNFSGSVIDFVLYQSDLRVEICIQDTLSSRAREQRNLAYKVEINSRFNWGSQCEALVSKANSRLGLIKKRSRNFPVVDILICTWF